MIKNFSKCLHGRFSITSTMSKSNFHSQLNKNSNRLFFTLKFNFTSSKNANKKSSESEINRINEYVIKYKPKNLTKAGDSLGINFKKLKKLNESNMFTVFQSNGKYFILKISITSLFMGVTVGILLYLTFSWFKNELKSYYQNGNNFISCLGYFLLFAISGLLTFMYIRNYRYKIWKFIKKIEISRDLKKLTFTTFLNKKFEEDLMNVYLYYNYTPYYTSIRTMTRVNDTLIIGIKKKVYVISLEDATIPDLDIFASTVRGYNLKAI
jgi:hypothetical protein